MIFDDFGGSLQTGKPREKGPDPPNGLAREGSITPHCQIPATKMPGRLLPGARRAGILASWQLGMGIVAFQEAKMCTEIFKISILGCQTLNFLMFLVPWQHGANVANNIVS